MTESWAGIELPEWFTEKYADYFHFLEYKSKKLFSFASKEARKYYGDLEDDEELRDIQKVMIEGDIDGTLSVVLLHECGGITLVFITKENIKAREPRTWEDVSSVTHSYCYGCSESDS